MADQKVSALAEETTVVPADILYILDAAGPTSKKATVENVQTDWHVGARVYNSGAISAANAAVTYLTFDSERYDTDTIHSTVANTGRLTATTAGKYLIIGNVQFAVHATGTRIVLIRLNGATILANNGGHDVDSVGITVRMPIATIYDMAATDYVEMGVYQDSGGALNVEAAANYSPEFMMTRIG